MYLIPCRHVMCSQRRHITDVEIYGKNAERFLSLRPSFSNRKTEHLQSKSNIDSSNDQRYEYTFSAYLEVRLRKSIEIFYAIDLSPFRMLILVLFVVALRVAVGQLHMMVKILRRIRS